MAGTAAFDRKDYKGAVEYWERLRSSQPADSPIVKPISGSIDEARQLGGMPPAPAAAAPVPQKAAPESMPPPLPLRPRRTRRRALRRPPARLSAAP